MAKDKPLEKRISELTIRVPEPLKRELQDQAAFEDRTLSDMIRVVLEIHVYGFKARREQLQGIAAARSDTRGTAL